MSLTYVVHFSEIALKGKNRPEFTRALRRNVRASLSALGQVEIHQKEGRLLVIVEGEAREVEDSLSRVFGVAWYARVENADRDIDALRRTATRIALTSSHARTFMVDARRTDKSYRYTSTEVARLLGSDIVVKTAMGVDLSNPELRICVDVLHDRALVYSDRMKGPGGLPVGTGGRVVHLFSGGIDSPVAAWLLMKRGCTPVYLHFYLAPTIEYPMKSKVLRLVESLARSSGGKATLILVPFSAYQIAMADAPEALEPSLFRRFMRLVGEEICSSFHANALSTGDCLAQAASQTIWNLESFDSGASVPILRPLLTYDKEEVISLARRIGTYEVSLEDYKDCCAIVTRHPRTRVRPGEVDAFAARSGFSELVGRSLSDATLVSARAEGGSTSRPLEDVMKKMRGPLSPAVPSNRQDQVEAKL